jgi:hypothetical protein
MRLNETERLLNDLRSGSITAADLSGEQFQSIIFHKLIEKCGSNREFEYELVDNYQGAVDFVVQEKALQGSQFHEEVPVHVFECKHYRRTLELSTVAKLLVVGVTYQPASLNIVSGTSLQPQVYEYARRLFSGLGNDAAMFRRTLFRHLRTSDLLELEIDCDDVDDIVAALGKAKKERAADISWEIAELRPFSEKIIAASSKRNGTIILDGRWCYRLRVSLFTSDHPERLRHWVEGLPSEIKQHTPKTEVTALGGGRHHVRFVQVVDTRSLETAAEGYLALHVAYGSLSHHVFTVPTTTVPPPGTDTSFPDLRQKEAHEFARLLQRREAPRLLLLGGAAGVGKTHLCESIAIRLQLTGEFDINRFSANPHSETSLLHTMLTAVCTPAAARSGSTDEWQELAASLLKALSPVPESRSSSLASPEPAEVLIPVLAELLVKAGPRLLVLRDAHLLTEATAREFGALVGRLDDLGWGDVYCVLEYRTPEGRDNPHWMTLEGELRARINGSLQRHLDPLSAAELNDFLDAIFAHITPELKNAIWNMCGGVPLYLFSLLDLLNSKGAIKYRSGKRWIIESPSALLTGAVLTLRRADGVLEERLKAISWEGTILPEKFKKAPLVLLGLLAIAHEPARVERLCQLADIKPEAYRSVRRTLMRHNIIRSNEDGWSFDFQHDLLRRVAIEVGRNSDSAQEVVERILANCEGDQSAALDLEFCADLATWMGFHEDAVRALNAAFERLRKSENFILIRRILGKLCESLEHGAFNSAKNYVAYLASRSALAWATWNTGSLIEAREEYARVAADAISRADSVIDAPTAEAYAADAQRRVLGIDLELDDVPRFIDSAHRALALNGHSIVFNSIMNRLILHCASFGHVDFGLELSHLLLQTFGDPEAESAGAVICSDIGSLFRAAAPQSALELYRRGVQLATDQRQQIYNDLDVLITEAMLGIRQPQPDELSAWRGKLVDNGLRSMLSRFDLFCASAALREGRIEQARTLYRHVETFIAVYRYEDQRLNMWNDRMIAALTEDDLNEAHRLQAKIITKVARLLEHRRLAFKRLQALRSAIETQRKRFSHLAPLKLSIPSTRPTYSGIFVHVLLNLESLAQVPGGVKQTTLIKVRELWPSDIDHTAATHSFLNQAQSSVIGFKGARLVLCAQ